MHEDIDAPAPALRPSHITPNIAINSSTNTAAAEPNSSSHDVITHIPANLPSRNHLRNPRARCSDVGKLALSSPSIKVVGISSTNHKSGELQTCAVVVPFAAKTAATPSTRTTGQPTITTAISGDGGSRYHEEGTHRYPSPHSGHRPSRGWPSNE
jgi:hypothetical protein